MLINSARQFNSKIKVDSLHTLKKYETQLK